MFIPDPPRILFDAHLAIYQVMFSDFAMTLHMIKWEVPGPLHCSRICQIGFWRFTCQTGSGSMLTMSFPAMGSLTGKICAGLSETPATVGQLHLKF